MNPDDASAASLPAGRSSTVVAAQCPPRRGTRKQLSLANDTIDKSYYMIISTDTSASPANLALAGAKLPMRQVTRFGGHVGSSICDAYDDTIWKPLDKGGAALVLRRCCLMP